MTFRRRAVVVSVLLGIGVASCGDEPSANGSAASGVSGSTTATASSSRGSATTSSAPAVGDTVDPEGLADSVRAAILAAGSAHATAAMPDGSFDMDLVVSQSAPRWRATYEKTQAIVVVNDVLYFSTPGESSPWGAVSLDGDPPDVASHGGLAAAPLFVVTGLLAVAGAPLDLMDGLSLTTVTVAEVTKDAVTYKLGPTSEGGQDPHIRLTVDANDLPAKIEADFAELGMTATYDGWGDPVSVKAPAKADVDFWN